LVRESISEMRAEGRTIVICTHNLDEADRLCDRVGVFRTQMLVVDKPDNLRSQLFGSRVVFHLVEARQEYAILVGNMPFISEVEVIDDRLVVTVDNPEKHNPEVVSALVGAGAGVQFVGELRRSLEDVYLRLVKE